MLLQEAERSQKLIENLQSEAHAASGRCAAAEKARENAEKAAADASAQLVTLQLELQSLRAAQSRAQADAEDFDQRVAAAIAGKTPLEWCTYTEATHLLVQGNLQALHCFTWSN